MGNLKKHLRYFFIRPGSDQSIVTDVRIDSSLSGETKMPDPHVWSSLLLRDTLHPEREKRECVRLTVMTILTQLCGAALIWFTIFFLRYMPAKSTICLIATFVVVVVPGLGLVWCWRDSLCNTVCDALEFDEPFEPIPPIRREAEIVVTVLALVVLDTIALVILIVITGGLGHSALDPLLPMIPIVAIILRQPKSTVFGAIIVQIAFTLLIVVHGWIDVVNQKPGTTVHALHKWFDQLTESYVYHSEKDPFFMFVFFVVAAGGIGISVLEYQITHGRSPLLRNFSKVTKTFHGQVEGIEILTDLVKQGARKWVKWLDSHMLPASDMSLVHSADVIAGQAIILSRPFWSNKPNEKKNNALVANITFLTYAAHWIDDQFDPVRPEGRHKFLQGKSPEEILCSDDRLQELLRYLRTEMPDAVPFIERAIIRIIYGGCIQNADTPARLNFLLKEYAGYVSEKLSPEFQEFYGAMCKSDRLIAIWVTSKVVIELLNSCAPDFKLDEAEFLNLLYGPILFFQDIQSERQEERFGGAFGDSPYDGRPINIDGQPTGYVGLPTNDDLLKLINFCAATESKVFGGPMPDNWRKQLELLRKTYAKEIHADIYKAYEPFIRKLSTTSTALTGSAFAAKA